MVLEKVINPVPHKFEVAKGYETSNLDDIEVKFEEAIMKNEEGLIMKQGDTFYEPNERNIKWMKLKADYIEGLIDTLDVIIMGGYYGEG